MHARDRPRKLWNATGLGFGHRPFTWVPRAREAEGYIDARLARAAAGKPAPYAQVDRASGRVVGTTAHWDPRGRTADLAVGRR
ncbi:hypothetical protein BIV23_24940 [Streptomyces monashensis]|uniref:Uncharacterized protein n=1 Tax=Streptomyces monashensis TaxID=1678012 RepID=A0A1S2Q7L1_9ACTN|nr:hypothetical protein BIV23_24940 [Streptomyces monashensis]